MSAGKFLDRLSSSDPPLSRAEHQWLASIRATHAHFFKVPSTSNSFTLAAQRDPDTIVDRESPAIKQDYAEELIQKRCFGKPLTAEEEGWFLVAQWHVPEIRSLCLSAGSLSTSVVTNDANNNDINENDNHDEALGRSRVSDLSLPTDRNALTPNRLAVLNFDFQRNLHDVLACHVAPTRTTNNNTTHPPPPPSPSPPPPPLPPPPPPLSLSIPPLLPSLTVSPPPPPPPPPCHPSTVIAHHTTNNGGTKSNLNMTDEGPPLFPLTTGSRTRRGGQNRVAQRAKARLEHRNPENVGPLSEADVPVPASAPAVENHTAISQLTSRFEELMREHQELETHVLRYMSVDAELRSIEMRMFGLLGTDPELDSA